MGNDLAVRVDESWAQFRAVVDALGAEAAERTTAAGWTVKEVLAHVAFWDETTDPVVNGMLRGIADMDDWRFGSGYVADEPVWPEANVHNAREAEWGRSQSFAAVIDRLDAAHAGARSVLGSLTDVEIEDSRFADFFNEKAEHYDEHRAELEELRG